MSARALLTLAEDGDDTATLAHIDAYADNSLLLNNLLRALSAAAEETPERAATARRMWPSVIRRVLNLNTSGHKPFHGRHFGDLALAALIPNAMMETTYLYSEVQDTPIAWWEPLALRSEVEEWLVPASGICQERQGHKRLVPFTLSHEGPCEKGHAPCEEPDSALFEPDTPDTNRREPRRPGQILE